MLPHHQLGKIQFSLGFRATARGLGNSWRGENQLLPARFICTIPEVPGSDARTPT